MICRTMENQTVLTGIASDIKLKPDVHRRLEPYISIPHCNLLQDPAFWRTLTLARAIMSPLVDFLDVVERDDASPHNAALFFYHEVEARADKNLTADCAAWPDERSQAKRVLMQALGKYRMRLCDPNFLLAMRLHPQKKLRCHALFNKADAKRFLSGQVNTHAAALGEEFHKEYGQWIANNLCDGTHEEAVLACALAGTQSPLEWWTVHKLEYPTLAKVALGLFGVVVSASSVERGWSMMGHIARSDRQRMKPEKAANVLFVRWNMLSLYNLANRAPPPGTRKRARPADALPPDPSAPDGGEVRQHPSLSTAPSGAAATQGGREVVEVEDDSDQDEGGVPAGDGASTEFVAAHPEEEQEVEDVGEVAAQAYLFNEGVEPMPAAQRRLLDDQYAPPAVTHRRHFAAVLPELQERHRDGDGGGAAAAAPTVAAARAPAAARAAAAAVAAAAAAATETGGVP